MMLNMDEKIELTSAAYQCTAVHQMSFNTELIDYDEFLTKLMIMNDKIIDYRWFLT